MIRIALVISLIFPLLTFLALGSETIDRTAQLHPAIVALTQLLITLTAFVYEASAASAPRSAAEALKEEP